MAMDIVREYRDNIEKLAAALYTVSAMSHLAGLWEAWDSLKMENVWSAAAKKWQDYQRTPQRVLWELDAVVKRLSNDDPTRLQIEKIRAVYGMVPTLADTYTLGHEAKLRYKKNPKALLGTFRSYVKGLPRSAEAIADVEALNKVFEQLQPTELPEKRSRPLRTDDPKDVRFRGSEIAPFWLPILRWLKKPHTVKDPMTGQPRKSRLFSRLAKYAGYYRANDVVSAFEVMERRAIFYRFWEREKRKLVIDDPVYQLMDDYEPTLDRHLEALRVYVRKHNG